MKDIIESKIVEIPNPYGVCNQHRNKRPDICPFCELATEREHDDRDLVNHNLNRRVEELEARLAESNP